MRIIGLALLVGVTAAASAMAETSVDITYSSKIRAIIGERCSSCHGAASPDYGEFKKDKSRFMKQLLGPRMDTYPHLVFFVGWPDSGAIMRRLDDGRNTKDGMPGNMYQYLGNDEEERRENLAVLKAWIGRWTLKRRGEMTKEEMDEIKVRY